MKKTFLSVCVLFTAPVFAQEPPPKPEAPAETPQPAEPAPPPAAALDERLAEVEGKVDGLNETFLETKSTVDKLNKLSVSGYIQGRYEWHDDAADGLKSTGSPANTSQFLVRRGRVKTTYKGTNSEFVLQIDATGKGVSLKDAEASVVDSWTPFELKLTVGQFKWPFGYEVLQSSGEREMPERTRVVRALFPGERDRGLRLQARSGLLRFQAALVNGNGTEDAIYTANDQNAFKDLVARVGADFGSAVVGVSGYVGENLKTTAPVAAKVAGMDANMDGKIVGDEITFTPAVAAAYDLYGRVRVGADAQFYVDIPGLGGLALKGEFIWAKDTHKEYQGKAADSDKDVTALGWWALAVQNIGNNVGAVFRVDQYDPNVDNDNDTITTLGGGLLYHVSGNTKLTFVFEHPIQQVAMGAEPKLDTFTAQLQAKF